MPSTHSVEGFDSASFAQLQQVSGVTDGQLQRLNATGQPLPVELLEVLEDVRAARVARRQPARFWPQTFAQLRRQPPSADPEAALLVRDFPELPVALAERIAAQAGDTERERLAAERVPLRLAEQARLALREVQLNRAYADLYLPAARRIEADRLLLAGASRLPGWPTDFSLVLRDTDEQGRELARVGPAEGDDVQVAIRTVAGYRLLAQAGRAGHASHDLAQILVHALTPAQWVELDLDDALWLRERVFEQVLADRDFAAYSIGQHRAPGWLRPPVRQPNGLVGYPLSGQAPAHIGLFRARVRQRLRQLYPRLDEARVRTLQAALGVEPLARLEQLEAQYEQLQAALDAWVQEPGAARDRHDQVVLVDPRQRRALADDVLAGWRRETLMIPEAADASERYQLVLDDRTVGDLPDLAADFSHISHLSLRRLGLLNDPSGFLRGFTGLHSLDLQQNRLVDLPEAISGMPSLSRLVARHNRLRGRDGLFAPLQGLAQLDALILSHNPLRLSAAAAQALGRLRSLTELRLNGCDTALDDHGFEQLARLDALEELSLEDNGIVLQARSLLPLARLTALRSLSLAGNPLGEAVDVSPLAQVRHLDLADCALSQWPVGLSGLMQGTALRWVSLVDNPLQSIPPLVALAFFQGASDFGRQRLEVSAALLDADSRARLAEVGIDALAGWTHDGPGPERLALRERDWLQGMDAVARDQWEQFNEQGGADSLFEALDRFCTTAMYRRDPEGCRRRLTQLLAACCDPDAEGSGQHHLRRCVLHLAQALVDRPQAQGWLERCEGYVGVYRAGLAGGEGLVAQVRRMAPANRPLAAWLLAQPAWRDCLARRSPRAIAHAQAPWREGLRYLDITGREPFDPLAVPAVTAKVLERVLAQWPGHRLVPVPGRSLDARQRQQARRQVQAALEEATLGALQRMTEAILAGLA